MFVFIGEWIFFLVLCAVFCIVYRILMYMYMFVSVVYNNSWCWYSASLKCYCYIKVNLFYRKRTQTHIHLFDQTNTNKFNTINLKLLYPILSIYAIWIYLIQIKYIPVYTYELYTHLCNDCYYIFWFIIYLWTQMLIKLEDVFDRYCVFFLYLYCVSTFGSYISILAINYITHTYIYLIWYTSYTMGTANIIYHTLLYIQYTCLFIKLII